MTGDELLARELIALSEEATAEEKMIESAYLAGAPLDQLYGEMYEDARADYQAARTRRIAGAAASNGATAPS